MSKQYWENSGLPTKINTFFPLRKIMIAPHISLKEPLSGKIIKINHVNSFAFYKSHLIL